MMNTPPFVTTYWVDDLNEVAELAALFVDNVAISYISHSEIQLGLAETPTRWNPNLLRMVSEDLTESIIKGTGQSGQLVTSLFAARIDAKLVAMGVVSMHTQGSGIPYAVLEDIVVRADMRHGGVGRIVLDWLRQEVRIRGGQRIFLESGAENHGAHEFFRSQGFRQCSVVMMSDL